MTLLVVLMLLSTLTEVWKTEKKLQCMSTSMEVPVVPWDLTKVLVGHVLVEGESCMLGRRAWKWRRKN